VLEATQGLSLFLVLKAFASGCTALTGVEAIATGVPNFKAPAANNARATLATLGVLAALMFGGLTVLADRLHVTPDEGGRRTVVSLIAGEVFGVGSLPFWFIQIVTMMILVLTANTAFNGFPLLASLMARDGFLPRQFNHVGDRLVYSSGIGILALAAMVLIVIFGRVVTALIPLYAIGVFADFTLSQRGHVPALAHPPRGGLAGPPRRLRPRRGRLLRRARRLLGHEVRRGRLDRAHPHPVSRARPRRIRGHHDSTAQQLSLSSGRAPTRLRRNQVIVPVGTIHRGVVRALEYAKTLSPDVKAGYVDADPQTTERLRRKWLDWGQGIELEILQSPYRSTTRPLFDYIREHDTGRRDEVITVVIPEFVPRHWWQQALHNQTALALKLALLVRRNTIVVSVPFHLDD
jgi:hypothetical protein